MSEDYQKYEKIQKEHWKDYYLFIQGFFYFAQGSMVILMALLPVYMQNLGESVPKSIALQGIIQIPWYIKIVYGILTDNVTFKKFGRRKPYIIIAGLMAILGAIILPLLSKVNGIFVLFGMFLALGIAVSDAAIDSLAVDVTPEHRRFMMQGIGWGGRGLGAAVSGITITDVAGNYGWNIAFLIPGIFVLCSCLLALFIKEPQITDPEKVLVFNKEDYKREFKKRDTWSVSLLMFISGSGIAILSVFSTYLDSAGLDIENVGIGLSLLALGQFLGAVPLGILGERMSIWKTMIGVTLSYVIMIIILGLVPIDNKPLIYTAIVVLGAINGAYEATQMRVGMEFSIGPISGSMYNWFMSMSNIGQIALGANIIAIVAESTSYPIGIQVSSVFLLLSLLIGWFSVRRLENLKAERKLAQNKNPN